jgi:chromosome partitioning protein
MPKSLAITLASSKGGQSKSLLAGCLAVRAMKDGRVALIDWEPQGSLSIWWKLRGQPSNPHLHPTRGDLAKDVAILKSAGFQTIIIDTPPTPMEPISRAIEAADFVVVPTRVGLFDIGGIRPVIGFCHEHKRPFLFVLTGTNPDAAGWAKLIRDANGALKKHGPVATKTIRERAAYTSDLTIRDRAAYISALNSGKAGSEIDKDAGAEINALWQAIKKQAGLR